MQLFALSGEDDLGQPIWSRVSAMREPGARVTAPAAGAVHGEEHVEARRRFAGRMVQAAVTAARQLQADELVLIGPPVVLASLRPFLRFLAHSGIEITHVPVALDRLAAGAARPLPLLGGAAVRGFFLATVPWPEAA